MENITYVSQENVTSLPQFPFWRETLSVLIITIIVIQLSVAATDLTLLVTMLRTKKLRHALNFIHISILVSQMTSRVFFVVGFLIYFPPAWQDCNCSVFVNIFGYSLYIFITVYEPVAFAFLSCLHLLQVKGKKRLTKIAVIFICISAAYSALFAIEFVAFQAKSGFSEELVCDQVCNIDQQEQTLSSSAAFIPVFLSFIPLAWIPSLITVIVTTTYMACVVFKKSYTGGDDKLSKRILSIPLVMPIVIIATNLFAGYFTRVVISFIFVRLPLGAFRRYWVIFLQFEVTFFLEGFSGFFYVILLLYLMPLYVKH